MSAASEPPEGELPEFLIEAARSGRSSCKACRRKIEKGALRLGVRIEGPFGAGHLWFHLKCAAKRRLEDVEAAYASRAWSEGLEVPALDSLRALAEEAEEAQRSKKLAPYAERSPSGRAKCKQCGEPLEQGAVRIVVLREVQFGNQVRKSPLTVHPRCVRAALEQPDSAHRPESFVQELRANTLGAVSDAGEIGSVELETALTEIGPLA